jgi:hypothetical protein
MRIQSISLVLLLTASMMGCSGGDQINGRSLKTANRSVSFIKERLPNEKRIEFEVSYWTLRDAIKNNEEFLDKVDGKRPDELIELGREIFQQRKSAGFSDYQKFNSWEQMITAFTQQRLEQNRSNRPADQDKMNNVLYKL